MTLDSSNPTAHVDNLVRSVRSKLSRITLCQGLVIVATIALVAAACALALDYTLAIRLRTVRAVVSFTVLGLTVAAFIKFLALPLGRRPTESAIARQIDTSNPALEERLETVTGWNGSEDPEAILGSEVLAARVRAEAESLSRQVTADQLIPTKLLRAMAVILMVVLLGWILCAVARPLETKLLVHRFALPFSDVTLTQIDARTGNAFGIRHEPFAVKAVLNTRARHRPVTMLYRDKRGNEDVIEMTMVEDQAGAYIHRFSTLSESFEYRISCADGTTPLYQVSAVDRPRLAQVAFYVTPPKYSKLPEVIRTDLPQHTRVLYGSLLELRLSSSIPLDGLWLLHEDGNREPLQQQPNGEYLCRRLLTNSLSLSPLLVESHGIENTPKPVCDIAVYQDAAPTVDLVAPDSSVAVQPDDKIEISFYAEDDFGITAAELVVEVSRVNGSVATNVMPIALAEQEGAKVVEASATLDLAALDVDHGDDIDVAVRVTDHQEAEALDTLRQQASARKADAAQAQSQGGARESDDPLADAQQEAPQELALAREEQNTDNPNKNESEPKSQTRSQSATDPSDGESSRSREKTHALPDFEFPDAPKSDKAESPPGESPESPLLPLWLNTPKGTCKSCSLQIKVDRFAGEYEAQQKDKLALDIYGYLKRMGTSLEHGIALAKPLLRHVASPHTRARWDSIQREQLTGTDAHVVNASETAKELNTISATTPYRMMGLQLLDIHHTDLVPARLEITRMEGATNRTDHMAIIVHHLERARHKLADLTAVHETAMKTREREKELLEIAVMYRLFAENMPTLMGSKKPSINSFSRSFLEQEFDEEQLKTLQDMIEQKREVLERLVALLAEDSLLRQRMMDQTRLQVTTLPDQLTLLARRHKRQAAYYNAWAKADEVQRPQILNVLRSETQAEGATLLLDAMTAVEKSTIWAPRSEIENPRVAKTQAGFRNVAATTTVLRTEAATAQEKDLFFQRLQELEEHLTNSLGREEDPKTGDYLANRLADVRLLIMRAHTWNQSDELLNMERGVDALAHSRSALMRDTSLLTHKFDAIAATVGYMPEPVPELAEALLDTLDKKLPPAQNRGYLAAKREDLITVQTNDAQAIALFTQGQQQCVAFVEAIIKEMDKETPSGSEQGEPPSVDQMIEKILLALEQEKRAFDSLGIPCGRPTNIQLLKDWMSMGSGKGSGSGSGPGSDSGSGSGSGDSTGSASSGNSAQAARATGMSPGEMMANAMRAAEAQSGLAKAQLNEMLNDREGEKNAANGLASDSTQSGQGGASRRGGGAQPGEGGAASGAENTHPNESGHDWTALASTLEDGVVHDKDAQVPAEYRGAIDAYFERLARKSIQNDIDVPPDE